MRILLAVLLSVVAFASAAQSTERPRPPGTLPLDEPPPPPPLAQQLKEPEPEVTRRIGDEGQVIEEYRIKGKLYMQKVTPKHGHAYVLMDHRGDGSFTKFDNSIDGHLAVPQWVLKEF